MDRRQVVDGGGRPSDLRLPFQPVLQRFQLPKRGRILERTGRGGLHDHVERVRALEAGVDHLVTEANARAVCEVVDHLRVDLDPRHGGARGGEKHRPECHDRAPVAQVEGAQSGRGAVDGALPIRTPLRSRGGSESEERGRQRERRDQRCSHAERRPETELPDHVERLRREGEEAGGGGQRGEHDGESDALEGRADGLAGIGHAALSDRLAMRRHDMHDVREADDEDEDRDQAGHDIEGVAHPRHRPECPEERDQHCRHRHHGSDPCAEGRPTHSQHENDDRR